MELFQNIKTIRLRSHLEKYLQASVDHVSVSQCRSASIKSSSWTVELVRSGETTYIRLKSCYGKYLTASNSPFLLGIVGRKVIQSKNKRLGTSVDWEPIREGKSNMVKLKTRYGNYLRANGGLPPIRNTVTHDSPFINHTQDWILWEVVPLEFQVQKTSKSGSLAKHSQRVELDLLSMSGTPKPPKVSTMQWRESSETPRGRLIYYRVVDECGEAKTKSSFNFKGNGVDELTRKLEQETGLEDIVVCNRSPSNGELYPLRLQLPPDDTTMDVVVIQASSKLMKKIWKQVKVMMKDENFAKWR
ncbi:hypothetical protein GIB67_000632 [Kingdonia uniflora]|uniref:DUF569 domain-containing protein n=1 Tax=Kingdonia uniflora TaxID=39325 RepID=A0A7J7NDU7_9MAGN|nr:hypothetical protein GIB67_000632 [Kingdonia uniflora]